MAGTGLTGLTLMTGVEEARQALLVQGLVVLAGFAGVIAQVVAMAGGGGLNDAGEDLGKRLRVLAVPSGVGPHMGEIGFGDVEEDLHGVEVVKGLLEAAVDDDAGLGFGDGSHERFRGGAAVGDLVAIDPDAVGGILTQGRRLAHVVEIGWRLGASGFWQDLTCVDREGLFAADTEYFVLGTHRLGSTGANRGRMFY